MSKSWLRIVFRLRNLLSTPVVKARRLFVSHVCCRFEHTTPETIQDGLNIPISNEWHFKDQTAQSNLISLLQYVQTEVERGQWPSILSNSAMNNSLIDRYFIHSFEKQLRLDPKVTRQLVQFICSSPDHSLESCSLGSNKVRHPTQLRCDLLNPGRIEVGLFDPLMHVGVVDPQKILAHCPELLIASVVPTRTQSSQAETDSHQLTVFLDALTCLNNLLPHKDLISLLHRFPRVLLRPRSELEQLFTYMTDIMGLQTCEMVRAARVHTQRHALRHSTGLSLVQCPAWYLPFKHVRARHLIALLAGLWPPSPSIDDNPESATRRLTRWLTCLSSRVPQYLGVSSSVPEAPLVRIDYPPRLSAEDVDAFHFIVKHTDDLDYQMPSERGKYSHSGNVKRRLK